MKWLALGLISLWMASPARCADAPTPQSRPKVVLIGDSIRLAYAPIVIKQLGEQLQIVSPPANGGDSANVLKNIEAWAIREQPAIVHFNCGIHDTKRFQATGKFQVSPEEYAANLRQIVRRLRTETKATVYFALTTPIVDERAAQARVGRDYELLNASTEQYNTIAQAVMKELDVPVNDLRAALGSPEEAAAFITADGVHLTAAGNQKLGAAVAAFLRERLATLKRSGSN